MLQEQFNEVIKDNINIYSYSPNYLDYIQEGIDILKDMDLYTKEKLGMK